MSRNIKELRGIRIVAKGDSVKTISSSKYLVRSESNPNGWYKVTWHRNHWVCNCPDYGRHGTKCKHIYAIVYYIALRRIAMGVNNPELDSVCPECRSKEAVVKRGPRHNRSGHVQTYYCRKCKRRFTGRTGFTRMKNEAQAIALSLDLYYKGLSLRKIKDHLKQFYNIDVNHTTIFKWIKKYTKLIDRYLKDLPINVSNRWCADETVIKVNGRKLRLWALLDDETRLLIAHHISEKRNTEEARKLIRMGLKRAEKPPLEFVTDGFEAYGSAINEEIKSLGGDSNHVLHLMGPFTSPLNNNKIERFFGTVKGRLKFAHHLKSEESAKTFAKGFSVYHNNIKPHESLDGLPPIALAGDLPAIDGNRWFKLIQEAVIQKVRRASSGQNA